MDCIFCKIIKGDIVNDKVFENETIIAFNDIHPQAPIHQLIVPKKHIATLNNLEKEDTELIGTIIQTACYLAKKAKIADTGYRTVFNCNKEGGQIIFHIHLHLIGGRILQWPPG